MSIYGKLAITSSVFLILMWVIVYPETKYAKWLTKKCGGEYYSALLLNIGIGFIPMIIIGLVYLWCEL